MKMKNIYHIFVKPRCINSSFQYELYNNINLLLCLIYELYNNINLLSCLIGEVC